MRYEIIVSVLVYASAKIREWVGMRKKKETKNEGDKQTDRKTEEYFECVLFIPITKKVFFVFYPFV